MELICFMNIFYRYGKQLLEGMLTDLDVNMQELIVMLVMHQSPGILQSRLLHFTGLDKGNFSKFLKQLEEKNHIYRKISRQAPGQNECYLSEEGEAMVCQLEAILQQWEQSLIHGIDSDSVTQFHTVSTQISHNLFERLNIRWM